MVEPPEIPEEAINALESEVGNDLRAVISYGGDTYKEHYVRNDVDADYTTEEVQAFIDDLSMQGLSRDHLESLFNAGSIQGTILGFEEALMFHFVQNEFQGLFVTYDRTAASDISEFIQLCEKYLDT